MISDIWETEKMFVAFKYILEGIARYFQIDWYLLHYYSGNREKYQTAPIQLWFLSLPQQWLLSDTNLFQFGKVTCQT